jgi:hypothetical protein
MEGWFGLEHIQTPDSRLKNGRGRDIRDRLVDTRFECLDAEVTLWPGLVSDLVERLEDHRAVERGVFAARLGPLDGSELMFEYLRLNRRARVNFTGAGAELGKYHGNRGPVDLAGRVYGMVVGRVDIGVCLLAQEEVDVVTDGVNGPDEPSREKVRWQRWHSHRLRRIRMVSRGREWC